MTKPDGRPTIELTDADIFSIERPHRRLLLLYVMRSLLTGPLAIVTLPVLFFRYETLHYKFDDEGIQMRWGILFRRQINLTYARIQDIHLTSGLLQRWLGLADLKIQTASGSSSAEMVIEGLMEYEAIRDFLYMRMRGYRQQQRAAAAGASVAPGAAADPQLAELVDRIAGELRATRLALERFAGDRAPIREHDREASPPSNEPRPESWDV
jgi:putative membrane protein